LKLTQRLAVEGVLLVGRANLLDRQRLFPFWVSAISLRALP